MAVTAEIDARSAEVKAECIEPEEKENHGHLKPVLLPHKASDPDCRAFIAHGPAMTKILQRRMIDKLGQWYHIVVFSLALKLHKALNSNLKTSYSVIFGYRENR